MEPRAETKNAVVLALSSNRGLCGGYNGNIIRLAQLHLEQVKEEVGNVTLEVSGKPTSPGLRYRKVDIDQQFTNFEDKPRYDEVDEIASRYLEMFGAGGSTELTWFILGSQVLHANNGAVTETLLHFVALQYRSTRTPKKARLASRCSNSNRRRRAFSKKSFRPASKPKCSSVSSWTPP